MPNLVTFRSFSALLAHFGISKYNMNDINHMYSIEHVLGINLNIGIFFYYLKKMVPRGPIVRENAKFGNFSTIFGIVSSFWGL